MPGPPRMPRDSTAAEGAPALSAPQEAGQGWGGGQGRVRMNLRERAELLCFYQPTKLYSKLHPQERTTKLLLPRNLSYRIEARRRRHSAKEGVKNGASESSGISVTLKSFSLCGASSPAGPALPASAHAAGARQTGSASPVPPSMPPGQPDRAQARSPQEALPSSSASSLSGTGLSGTGLSAGASQGLWSAAGSPGRGVGLDPRAIIPGAQPAPRLLAFLLSVDRHRQLSSNTGAAAARPAAAGTHGADLAIRQSQGQPGPMHMNHAGQPSLGTRQQQEQGGRESRKHMRAKKCFEGPINPALLHSSGVASAAQSIVHFVVPESSCLGTLHKATQDSGPPGAGPAQDSRKVLLFLLTGALPGAGSTPMLVGHLCIKDEILRDLRAMAASGLQQQGVVPVGEGAETAGACSLVQKAIVQLKQLQDGAQDMALRDSADFSMFLAKSMKASASRASDVRSEVEVELCALQPEESASSISGRGSQAGLFQPALSAAASCSLEAEDSAAGGAAPEQGSSSKGQSTSVIFCYKFQSGTGFWTQEVGDLRCPLCTMFCANEEGMKTHLPTFHDRFNYTFFQDCSTNPLIVEVSSFPQEDLEQPMEALARPFSVLRQKASTFTSAAWRTRRGAQAQGVSQRRVDKWRQWQAQQLERVRELAEKQQQAQQAQQHQQRKHLLQQHRLGMMQQAAASQLQRSGSQAHVVQQQLQQLRQQQTAQDTDMQQCLGPKSASAHVQQQEAAVLAAMRRGVSPAHGGQGHGKADVQGAARKGVETSEPQATKGKKVAGKGSTGVGQKEGSGRAGSARREAESSVTDKKRGGSDWTKKKYAAKALDTESAARLEGGGTAVGSLHARVAGGPSRAEDASHNQEEDPQGRARAHADGVLAQSGEDEEMPPAEDDEKKGQAAEMEAEGADEAAEGPGEAAMLGTAAQGGAVAKLPEALRGRKFYHSQTWQEMTLEELAAGVDSESERDDALRDWEEEQLVNEFVDVQPEEKAIMIRWKAFVRRQRVLADAHVPWACEAFARMHAPFLGSSLVVRMCFMMFLMKLWHCRLVGSQVITNCARIVNSARQAHIAALQEAANKGALVQEGSVQNSSQAQEGGSKGRT